MFIYIHIAHRMQTMRRGRCNRRLWCLREVQRLERQNEPLLDVNLSMMKKHLFLCGIEYAKENKLRSYIQHVWLKAASLVHFDAKAVVRWEVEKKRRQAQEFPDEVTRELVRQKIAGVRKHKSIVFEFVWQNRLRSEIFAGFGFLGLCTENWTLFLS